MEQVLAKTALDGRTAEDGLAARIEDPGLRAMIALRGDLAGAAMTQAVQAIAGVDAPRLRRFAVGGGYGVYWMSPDELMITGPYAEARAMVARLDEALADEPHLAVDVSDARQVYRLTGAAAREILAKGAPVDLHPGAFGVGDFRRTRLGPVAVAISQIADSPDQFELICFRSYAEYVWRWLTASAKSGSMPHAFDGGRA